MVSAPIPQRSLLALLLLSAAGATSGCAQIPDLNRPPPINMSSPTAKAIKTAIDNPGPFPTFADIPPLPAKAAGTQPPTATAPRGLDELRVQTVLQAGPVIDSTPEAEAYAARQRAAAGAVAAPTEADQAATEAYAAAQRARATPPSGR